MSASVQFRSLQATIAAYEAMEITAWSLWQGSSMLPFMYCGSDINEGATQLRDWLKRMGESTNAVYTLKLYRVKGKGKTIEIKKNTQDDGCINFRLNDPDQMVTNDQWSRYNNNAALMQELTSLKAELAALKAQQEDDDYDDDDGGVLGKIGELLEKPTISKLVGKIFNVDMGAATAGATINGVPDDQLLQQAIATLRPKVKNLGELLLKVAQLADSDPITFAAIIGKLNSL